MTIGLCVIQACMIVFFYKECLLLVELGNERLAK